MRNLFKVCIFVVYEWKYGKILQMVPTVHELYVLCYGRRIGVRVVL